MSRAENQYLDRYAEPEARELGPLRRRFGHVLTIPAYGEGRELMRALASIPAGALGDVLTVLVINGRSDSPASMKEANRAALEALRADGDRGIPLGSFQRRSGLQIACRAYSEGRQALVRRSGNGKAPCSPARGVAGCGELTRLGKGA